jgi:hypothetical protein
LDSADNQELFSIVEYLTSIHDYKEVSKYFEQDIEKIVFMQDTSEQHYVSNNSVSYLMFNTMGLDRYNTYRDNRVYLNSDNTISYEISGYNKSIDISYTTYTNTSQFSPEGMGINKLEFSNDNKSLIVNYEGDEFEFDLSKLYGANYESNVPVAQENLTFLSETGSGKYKLIINSVYYEKGSRIETMRGMLLVGI